MEGKVMNMDETKISADSAAMDKDKYASDSSVNHKGKLPLRASTGVWKASRFIIAIEFSERLSYFGISFSLIIYLTKVLHWDLKTAAKSVNYWSGVTALMPLLGGFLADAYLGRFFTVLASSIIYVLGLILLTMSSTVPAFKPCGTNSVCLDPRKIHEVIFFLGIYLISIGTGGHKPALESFGADQFDDNDPVERRQKMSYFNWWNFGLCSGLTTAVTVIVYVQDKVSWAAADVILTIVMTATIVIFCVGRPFYRYQVPPGSPLTPLLQVVVAAFAKRRLECPSNSAELYEVPKLGETKGRLLYHTQRLKFLDKAAILEGKIISPEKNQSPWRLATVTKVEELKLMISILPIWLTTLMFGICVAQSSTFFIKQSTTLNRNITASFQIPAASIYCIAAAGMIATVTIYEKILVPLLRKMTGTERGINILPRIGIGMVFSVLSMLVAALVESKRLAVVTEMKVKSPAQIPNSLSMSVFWLAPQFLIIGIADGFTLVGLQEYFYDQVPDSMRSLGIAFYLSVLGAASFLSSLLIIAVDGVTDNAAGKGWIGKDLNSSRLDLFYGLLAALTAVNLAVYVAVARRYSYKNVQRTTVAVADCSDGDGGEEMA